MGTPDFEHGTVYIKQFGAERVNSSENCVYTVAERRSLEICIFLLNSLNTRVYSLDTLPNV